MFRVKLLQPEVDYMSGRVIARQEVIEGNYREFYDIADKDKHFDVSIKRHRNHRSLDANAYYHVLINKIAGKLGVSMAEVKNLTLGRYGQLELDEEDKPIEFAIQDNFDVSKRSDVHLLPTSEVEYRRGKVFRIYQLIRGSHTYNSSEMYHLIRGTIEDAKDAGLTEAEIMTPREREILGQIYGVKI